MSENGIGSEIAGTLAEALGALEAIAASAAAAEAMLARTGIDVTLDEGAQAALAGLLPGGDELDTLLTVAAEVAAGEPITAADVVAALEAADSIVAEIGEIASLPPGSFAALPPPLDDPDTWSDLALAVLDQLIASIIEHRLPAVYGPLRLARVLDQWIDPATGTIRAEVDWALVAGLLTDPAGAIRAAYGWGGELVYDRLQRAVHDVVRRWGFGARLIDVPFAQWERYYSPYPVPYGVQALHLPIYRGYVPALDAVARVGVDLVPVPAEPGSPITISQYWQPVQRRRSHKAVDCRGG